MKRFAARLLLLFACAGTFLPVALQAMAAPPRACCRRKSAQQCHEMAASNAAASNPDESSIRSGGCCNHDCCRTLTTSQWADYPKAANIFSQSIDGSTFGPRAAVLAREVSRSHSSRAPPQPALA